MPDDPSRPPAVETLPTVTLEHARTGQPIVVDLRDYLAGKDGRYADWRLFGQGRFIDPPGLKSEGGPPDPEPTEPEAAADVRAAQAPARRRRRKHRRSRS